MGDVAKNIPWEKGLPAASPTPTILVIALFSNGKSKKQKIKSNKYPEPDEKVKKCNHKMEKVVNSDGSTEWKTFLDVRKSFVSLVFSPIS